MKCLMFEHQNVIQNFGDIDDQTLNLATQANARIVQLLRHYSYMESLSECVKELDEARKKMREPQEIQSRRIERKVRSYLSEYRVLLDHWDHAFSKKSAEYHIMKKVTSEMYDTNKEYGFVYHLRNYAVHCGNVVHRISASMDSPDINPYCSKDYLLQHYKEWKSYDIAFLKNQKDYFELMPILKESFIAVQKINDQMMDLLLNQGTIDDCKLIEELFQRIRTLHAENGTWDVVEWFDTKGFPIPFDNLRCNEQCVCERQYMRWNCCPILRVRAETVVQRRILS